jgi:VIT1/CCC1 family predicted Fe2+/Mn2+ transporter
MKPVVRQALLTAQCNEITEHHVYASLARFTKNARNRRVLETIAHDELRHYEALGRLTGESPSPRRWMVFLYSLVARVFGLTFGLKLMESGESLAENNYLRLAKGLPDVQQLARDEKVHEKKLLGLLDEDFLQYVSSIVLGINDALVELTGSMAGLTFALSNSRIVALAGIITGIAAGLSMAASEYLSKRHEGGTQSPYKASFYTGVAYLLTLTFLVFPYLLPVGPFAALSWMLANALLVILVFTFYVSVALEQPFWSRFGEMAGLSLFVAVLSFGIGAIAQHFLGIQLH